LALAEADVGIAMGAGGSEVAIEAADIALVKDELSGVVYVRSLSRATVEVVRQNFWIATGTNLAGVALGAAGLLSPVLAGLFHVVHTAGILANSSRLLAYEPPHMVAKRSKKERRPATDSPAPAESRVVAFPRAGKTG
jgi:cation-transporting P-type ATPase C